MNKSCVFISMLTF